MPGDAQASVYDEICQAIAFAGCQGDTSDSRLLGAPELDPDDEDACAALLRAEWTQEDLRYFASKGERIDRFQRHVFTDEVEQHFLNRKLAHDRVTYSLIRVVMGPCWLHQRLLEGEADFGTLASRQWKDQNDVRAFRTCSFDQAQTVVKHARMPGRRVAGPFFLVNIWLILRLDRWEGARLDAAMRRTCWRSCSSSG